jgi:hypothetical protein
MKQSAFKKGTSVLSRDGKEQGEMSGSTHRCQMEGCLGVRVSVKWSNGQYTYPCSKGMVKESNGSYKLG